MFFSTMAQKSFMPILPEKYLIGFFPSLPFFHFYFFRGQLLKIGKIY